MHTKIKITVKKAPKIIPPTNEAPSNFLLLSFVPGSVVTGADVVVDVVVGVGLVEVELGMGVVVVDGSILVVVLGVEVVLELLIDSVVVV